jgi:uncharacterized repeat protein (TIGR03803 family)
MRKISGRFGTMVVIVASIGMMLAAAIAAPAQKFTTLVNFDGPNGSYPSSSFVQGADGDLYGATNSGGANGGGTIVKMTPSGVLTTLYSFCSEANCEDGQAPYTGPVLGFDGNLYGTTFFGGGNASCPSGCGTVFKVTPMGELTTLHNFQGTDGSGPVGMAQGNDGAFYGIAVYGGNSACLEGCGTVFRITPAGQLTTLHSFDGTDGAYPEGVPVQDIDGTFYGTTVEGGNDDGGTVFKMTAEGALTTLYRFCSQPNCTDGDGPETGLVRASNGKFYGTTGSGGSLQENLGTVFEITPSGILTTLHVFCSLPNCADGGEPYTAPLIQATDDRLYGTTVYDGGGGGCFPYGGCGTVFSITLGGTLTTLQSFDGTDGYGPWAAVYQDTDGKFYGTTHWGGSDNLGTVFSLGVGLGPFVEALPASNRIGASVKILGTDLTGTTSVTFNGTPAKFSVISSTEIATTVPTGAATGPVQVVTPSGTLTSNADFRVEP